MKTQNPADANFNISLTRTERYSDDYAGPDPDAVVAGDAVGFWGELTGTLDMVSILDLGADHKEGAEQLRTSISAISAW